MTTTLNNVADIDARRTQLATEARTMLDTATTDLEGDDLVRYEAIEAELTTLQTRRDRMERLERHVTAGSTTNGANTPNFHVGTRNDDPYSMTRSLYEPDMHARAITAVERTTHLADAHKARMVELIERLDGPDNRVSRHIIATGRPEYRTGWQKLVSGNDWAMTNEEREAFAQARAVTLAGTAGYAVPATIDTTMILTSAGSVNPFRQISRVISTTTDDWSGVTSAGVTAAFSAESAEVADNSPTLVQPNIIPEKAQGFVPFSIEAGMDWVSIESDLREAFMDAKDTLETTKFALGAGHGSNEPMGIVTALVAASSPIVTSSTSNAFVVADVYALLEKVPPRHRSNASWVMALPTINKIRAFGTAVSASFTVDLTAAGIPGLLGRPIYEASAIDATYGSGENYIAICGNFQRFAIVDRIGMTVELVPHLFHTDNNRPNGQRGLYCYWRTSSGVLDTSAFGILNIT